MISFAVNNGISYTTHQSGILYQIILSGNNNYPTISSDITVDYVGKLMNGTTFDSSNNVTFPLNALIEGWKIGVPLIGIGGRIKLIIPSSLAYGCQGAGIVPPNSPLYFDITLDNATNTIVSTPTPTPTPTITNTSTPTPTPTLTPIEPTQLLSNSDFSLGTTNWSATGGFGTYSYTSSNQVAVLDGILYFTYVSRTVSQSVDVSSYISSANSFEGVLNIRHRQKSDDGGYTQIDTYNFTLLFKNSGGTTITTKTTGTSNAPQNFTDITLTLNRSEIPLTFDSISTVQVQITGIDTGFWNGNHGPMVNYVNLNIS